MKTTERLTIEDCQVGFPIRTSRDRRVLSPPPGLSQSATSFIASCCQGIHQTPLSRLIRSRRRRALLLDGGSNRQPIPKPWTRSLRPGTDPRQEDRPVQQARNAPKGRPSSRSVSFDLERLLFSPRASRPSAGARPTWRTPNSVSCFALFTMSSCRMSPSGVSVSRRDLAIGQEGSRK